MGNAALAAVRDADLLGGAGVAGEGDDIHQGLLKILLVGGGLLDAGGDGHLLLRGLQVHAQGQTEPLLDDGTLQEHVVAVLGHLALDHLVGDLVHTAQIAVLIGQTGHFGEYVAADIVHRAMDTSHMLSSSMMPGGRIPSRVLRFYYIKTLVFLQGPPIGKSLQTPVFFGF